MSEHSCNKEKELAEMKTNQKWIVDTLKEISPKINTMHDTFITGEGKIKVLNKAVFGNGKDGIIDKVDKIEKTIDKVEGGKIVLGGIGRFTKWAIGIVLASNVGAWFYLFTGRV